jgi:hypothetical protein
MLNKQSLLILILLNEIKSKNQKIKKSKIKKNKL